MAKKDIERNVRKAITKENAKFKSKFFPTALGGTSLVEFTWGTDALITGCIQGTNEILTKSRTNSLLTKAEIKAYNAANTKTMWESIAKEISLEAKRQNIIGKVGVKTKNIICITAISALCTFCTRAMGWWCNKYLFRWRQGVPGKSEP